MLRPHLLATGNLSQARGQRCYSRGTLLSRSYLLGWWFWTSPMLLASISAGPGPVDSAGRGRGFSSWSFLESDALANGQKLPWAWRSEVTGIMCSNAASDCPGKELKEGGSPVLGSDETWHHHMTSSGTSYLHSQWAHKYLKREEILRLKQITLMKSSSYNIFNDMMLFTAFLHELSRSGNIPVEQGCTHLFGFGAGLESLQWL